MGAPLAEERGGPMDLLLLLLLLEADCHDMEERAELTDQRDAWPEDPELVEETDILVRWENGYEGGRKTELSGCS